MNNKPICIVKTEGEWKEIEKTINDMGRKNLNSFIRVEVNKLGNAYAECPNCVSKASGKRTYKRPKISIESHKKIERLAKQMKLPVSTVIDILIILPLLRGKASVN